MRAEGTFTVALAPLPTVGGALTPTLAHYSIDKQFHGALEGSSKGEMLSAGTGTEGSAGYVAMEHVTGTLGGRRGSFSLQHTGSMNRGVPTLSVTVVPDSGTDELAGLAGSLDIIRADGKHSYVFEYSMAPR